VPGENERGSARAGRGVLGVAAALGLVGTYLAIAAAAHLTPWHAAATSASTPATSASPVFSASPSSPPGVPGSAPATLGASAPAAAQALLDLIPRGVRGHGCPVGQLILGAIAVRNCSGVSYGPGKADAVMTYYLFTDDAAMNHAYAEFLAAAHVRQGSGDCAGFTSFRAPCETAIKNASPVMTGRAVEFTHAGEADVVSSDEQRHVLVYITARDGQAMLKWWLHPDQWLVTG
jgi:hypothetical protein